MRHLYLMVFASLLSIGSALAQTDTLWQESFETDGSGGTRYTLSAAHANDGGFEDYWERGDNTAFGTYGMDMAPISGLEGSNFLGAEDMDAAGISGSAATVTFNDVLVTSYENLSISFMLAANEVANFDYATRSNGDYVLVEYAVDGGGFDTLAFFTTEVNASSQRLEWDTDLDGFGDSLTSGSFTTYSFDIPETGSTVSVKVSLRTDAGDEEIALDNFMLKGDAVATAGDQDSEVINAAQPTGSTINANTSTTEGSAVAVFAFAMDDPGTADGLDTEVTNMIFSQAANNTVSDWSAVIAGAVLFDGSTEITQGYTATINPSSITIAFDTSYTVGDTQSSNNLTLKIWLQETSEVEDNSVIAVEVPTNNAGWIAESTGSVFLDTFGSAVTGNDFILGVEATAFTFDYSSSAFVTNTDLELTVKATNDFGAVAKNTHRVTLSRVLGTGNLSSATGLSQNLTDGVFTWTDIRYDLAEEMAFKANNDSASYSANDTLTFIDPITGTTTLQPGDLAIIGANTDGDDDFAFVVLKDVGADTEIFFTDDEWNSTNGTFNTGEGFLSYTPSAAGLPAGSVVVINPNDTVASDGGTVNEVDGNFSRGTGGDHLYAYTASTYNDSASVVVLFAHTHYATWFDSNIDGSGLKNDITAVSPFSSTLDNVQYNGSRTLTKSGLFANLAIEGNYATDNSVTQDFDTSPFTFVDGDVSISAPAVQVAASTLDAINLTVRDSAVSVFGVEITDDGGDGLDATLYYFPVVPAATNTVDWTRDIADVLILKSGVEIADDYSVEISQEGIDITFTTGYTIADNTTESLTLAVQLADTSAMVDSSILSLEISDDLLCWVFDGGGSTPDLLGSSITGNDQVVDIVATDFTFTQNTTPIYRDSTFSVTITAVNAWGAIDTGADSVTVGNTDTTGTLSSATGLTQVLSGGSLTYSDLVYDQLGDFNLEFAHQTEGFTYTSATLSAVDGSVPSVYFLVDQDTANEGDTTFLLRVALDQPSADTATSVDVVLISGDSTRLDAYTTQTITFPAGDNTTQAVTITLTDDATVGGTQTFVFALQNLSSTSTGQIVNPDSATLLVEDNDFVVLNEIDPDQSGTDTDEFIELYDGGTGNISLDGYVIVLYNGSDDRSYAAYDLDGQTTDANGYFVLGTSTVTNVDMAFPSSSNNIQNGADAVALYFGLDDTDFPNDTDLDTSSALVDALVYDTNDSDDSGLAPLMLEGPQVNEGGLGNSGGQSVSRLPAGNRNFRNGYYWSPDTPTPGEANVDNNAPQLVLVSPFDEQADVAVDTDLSIEYSELITVDSTKGISLLQNLGSGFEEVVSFTFTDSEVTLGLNSIEVVLPTLDSGATYQVKIDSGALQDLSGNVDDGGAITFYTIGDIPFISFITDPFQSEPVLDFGRVDTAAADTLEILITGSNLQDTVNLSIKGEQKGSFLISTDLNTWSQDLALMGDGNSSLSQTVYVLFQPEECGLIDQAVLEATTKNGNLISAALTGRGNGGGCADFIADTRYLDFGVVTTGQVMTEVILADAANLADLTLAFADSASVVFSLSLNDTVYSDTSVVITDGTFTDLPIYVRFSPDSVGDYTDTLTLTGEFGGDYGIFILTGTAVSADSIISIAEARSRSVDSVVTVAGRVTVGPEFEGPSYIQDQTAGIPVFSTDFIEEAQIGDSVVVTGTLSTFFDLLQISGDVSYTIVAEDSTTEVSPTTIAAANMGSYEGQLVTITAAFDQKTDLLYPDANFELTDSAGTGFELRIEASTDLVGRTRPQNQIEITGVVGQFSGTYQLIPRGQRDMEGTEAYTSQSTDYPTANSFDVATWNMEFFGSTVDGFGPRDKDLQVVNAAEIIKALDVDIIAAQEVSNEQRLTQLMNLLDNWEYVCSDVYSFSFTGPDPDFPAQKLCYLYNTETVTVTDSWVFFEDFYTSERITPNLLASHPGGSAQSFWSSGRLPYGITVQANTEGSTGEITLVNVHAKSGSASNDVARKEYDANVLYDSLNTYYAGENIIILGDFNDDLDESIRSGTATPYSSYLTDSSGYEAPSLDLSLDGLRSFVSSSNVIDHQVISDDLAPFYLDGSVEVFIPFNVVESYESTTSDHLPIVTRFDFTPYAVSFVDTLITSTEGSTGIVVTLEAEPTPDDNVVTFDLVSANGSVSDQLEGLSDTLSLLIPAGATTATLQYDIADNTTLEPTDTISFTLATSTGNQTRSFVEPTEFLQIIEDNDTAFVSLEVATLQVTEGDTATLGLTLLQAHQVDVVVTLKSVDSSATGGTDYAALDTTVTIPAGDVISYFDVVTYDDDAVEADELFTYQITGASPVSIVEGNTVVTIINNDAVAANFASTTLAVAEGDSLVEATILLDQALPFEAQVAVNYALGTASTADFSSSNFPDTLHFAAGDSAATIYFNITDDEETEDEETLTFYLTSLSNTVVLGTSDSLDVRIGASDPPISEVNFVDTEKVATEGTDSTVSFDLVLTHPNDTVAVVVGISLAQGDTADLNNFTTQYVTFPAGGTDPQTFTVSINDDDITEATETFTFSITSVSGGGHPVLAGLQNQATLTLLDNDVDETEVFFVSDAATVSEADGSVALAVGIRHADSTATSVDVVLTSGDTADIGGYTTQTVTFAAGDTTEQVVTVLLTNNDVVEGDRTFTFQLQNVTGGLDALITAEDTFTLTVTSEDVADTAVVAFAANSATISENGGTATINVSLSKAVDEEVTASVSFNSGDVNRIDGFRNAVVTFPANDNTPQAVTVTITDNDIVDGDATLTFAISSATTTSTQSVVVADQTQFTLTIEDDEVTGLDDEWLAGVSVYPNPAEQQLTVALADGINPFGARMTIYTLDGRIMVQQDASGEVNSVAVHELPAGIYLLKVTANDRTAIIRFSVRR